MIVIYYNIILSDIIYIHTYIHILFFLGKLTEPKRYCSQVGIWFALGSQWVHVIISSIDSIKRWNLARPSNNQLGRRSGQVGVFCCCSWAVHSWRGLLLQRWHPGPTHKFLVAMHHVSPSSLAFTTYFTWKQSKLSCAQCSATPGVSEEMMKN